MNLRFLEAFYWVAKLGSVTRAAERLSLTQAGVSSRIASLEADMRTNLFERRNRRLTLSQAGVRLLPRAERMLHMERDIRLDLDLADPGLPILRLGVIETIAHTWLLDLLDDLRRDRQDTELELTIENTPLLAEQFSRGMLDIAILAMPQAGDGIRSQALPPLQLTFVQRPPAGERRVPRVEVSARELASRQLLTFQRGSPTQTAMMDLFRRVGATPQHVHGVSSLSAMLRLAEKGFGVATLPCDLVRPFVQQGLLQCVDTEEPLPSLPLFVTYRTDPVSNAIEDIVARILFIARDHERANASP
ncbi:LysR family transcriptional regulator [Verticiella sediminum]|uniref:LysR family transcriptional regulator n=1 Tax=Verticiella sediminum TaxID=1247510 RepID=A0A556AL62_9BURK|nr:LysR family transcriptional regulator [Verticiella sediminum]TSH93626.1 LysR family transcriptional regulator [Verticiella sediminum]